MRVQLPRWREERATFNEHQNPEYNTCIHSARTQHLPKSCSFTPIRNCSSLGVREHSAQLSVRGSVTTSPSRGDQCRRFRRLSWKGCTPPGIGQGFLWPETTYVVRIRTRNCLCSGSRWLTWPRLQLNLGGLRFIEQRPTPAPSTTSHRKIIQYMTCYQAAHFFQPQ
jgi:hypothetical protein